MSYPNTARISKIFHALADENRRRLLDRLRDFPNQTITQLCEFQKVSRQAVTKHLKVLEAAALVGVVRQGRERLYSLHAEPIVTIADWTEQVLAKSRSHTSTENPMSDDSLTTESTVYVTYVAATAEAVWEGLTSYDFTRKYFFGHTIESSWEVGAGWRLLKPDGRVNVYGIVRECDPPRKLEVTWLVEEKKFKHLPECIVTYNIEPVRDTVVRLTMTEAHPTPIKASLLEGGRQGWPMILSGLKTLLETGKPLVIPMPK